ncbi:hypothetical protein [Actinomadura decatromicini]|uniref:FXSXX-COOH protein n=1 Tax=Actinomadura decatromicini TaxID=2604572 RepID=A0A5D3FXS3_9ACTN|nr:hypothetical protein [Actinomadura decatromicini]TYK52868.1 hypothetical protein FXF68_03705 [Actinomadura decatromicini]
MQQQETTIQGGLIDVSGLSLHQLGDEIGGSVFEQTLREILAAPGESAVCGFDSIAAPPPSER